MKLLSKIKILSSLRRSGAVCLVAFVIAGFAFAHLSASAQQPAAQHPDAKQGGQSSDGNFITPQTQKDQNLAAAEQEDDDAVYKRSASVRAIGHMLHLSPRASSVAFEDFNFVLLAGVILYYAAKLLPGFFRGRQQELDKHLVEARVATEEAQERLKVVEQRLGRLDQEIEQLRTRAEQDGAADEKRIKESIEEERRKIIASAEQEIAAMASTAERNLRKFGAEIAIARATGRLHLSEADDRSLIHDFGTGLTANTAPDLDRRRN